MKKVLLYSVALLLFFQTAFAEGEEKDKEQEVDKKEESKEEGSKYDKLLKDAESSAKGLMTIHKVKDKIYLEIPNDLLGKDMIFTSMIARASDDVGARTGQMQSMARVRFDKDGEELLMKDIKAGTVVKEDHAIEAGFRNNFFDPTREVFKIEASTDQDSSVVIDFTTMILSTKGAMGMPKKALWNMKPTGAYAANAKLTKILGFQSFEKNINVSIRLGFTKAEAPTVIEVNRGFALLPEEPMERRLYDRRMNHFFNKEQEYSDSNQDGPTMRYFINKWNLKVKEEDVERYKRGELVVPENQLIWYVDSAFPESWKKYIKLGIEDWQQAFEAIGFKDAIIAKDYPKNDSTFNPMNITYKCFTYIPSTIANGMGSAWADPRTGEYIGGRVYVSHGILKQAKAWRFVQTAAVDPEARKKELSEEVVGGLIRNIAAHEIGHTLGLMHNFRGSFAIPTDSLRSASYTKKHGTTATIMDYTRYNFVAQPGDEGVELLPPPIGSQDIHAIKLAYKPIFGADTHEEQYKVVNGWLQEKYHDPRYIHGPQPKLIMGIGSPTDPASQDGDLGDDPVKSSQYGISNLKIITSNLVEWTAEEGKNYNRTHMAYTNILKQYYQHTSHVFAMLGGIYMFDPVYGDGGTETVNVSKDKQKEALQFLLNEARDIETWMRPEAISKLKVPSAKDAITWHQRLFMDKLVYMAGRVHANNRYEEDPYTLEEYMDDIAAFVWEPTLNGEKELSLTDRTLQNFYLRSLISYAGIENSTSKKAGSKSFLSAFNDEAYQAELLQKEQNRYAGYDSAYLPHDMENIETMAASPLGSQDLTFEKIDIRIENRIQLKKAADILKKAMKKGGLSEKTRNHYEYLYNAIAPLVD